MFSKACEYAIRAAIFIAKRSREGRRASLKDIASKIDSPSAFTAKILQKLVHANILKSIKGAKGGFEVDLVKMSSIQLADVVNAIDGNHIYKSCGLGLKECSEAHPCPLHDKFKRVRNRLSEILENTTLEELAIDMDKGATFLKTD